MSILFLFLSRHLHSSENLQANGSGILRDVKTNGV